VVKTGFVVHRQRPSTARRALRPVALLLGIALGCSKKQPDQLCTTGEVSCFDERTGLFCRDGKLATMTCLGPAGCQNVGKDEVACDNPVAHVGDGCNQTDDMACTEDGKNAVTCRAYKFVVSQACRGPRGCATKGDRADCDNSLADPGDPCTTEGDTACQTSRATLLKCTKGTFRVSNGCRGAKHCTVATKPDENNENFECDDSMTEVGDPCEDDGELSCSVDHKTLNVCKAHQIALNKVCPSACSWSATTARFDCDTHKR
jgi:hypothetical protein